MIALGSDHGGYNLKKAVIAYFKENGIAYQDFGCYSRESCDYPEYARAAAQAVADGDCEKGIVLCTTGLGISMAANKVRGIRCAVCDSVFLARMTREHNDANMLSLGAAVVGAELAVEIIDTFLNTPFSNEEKHLRRVKGIEVL